MSGSDWKGDNPFYLLIRHAQATDGKMVGTIIDLDEGGWVEKHDALTKQPGRWYLVNKASGVLSMAMVVGEGEEGFYKRRHVGVGNLTPEKVIQNEVMGYGLGRKLADGHEEIMWLFPQGPVTCMGDDANTIGMELLKVVNAAGLIARGGTSTMS